MAREILETGLECGRSSIGEDPRFLTPESKAQYAPHRVFKPTHIRLDLRVDVKKQHAEGMCTTHVELFESTEKIPFDAVNLKISKVEVNGHSVKFEYDENTLTVPTAKIGKKGIVRIHYSVTKPKLGIFFIHPTKDQPNKPYQAWTHSESQEARAWYPCQDQPESKCPIEMHITVPAPFNVVANGDLTTSKPSKDKKETTFSWKLDSPNAPYLNAFMVGDFDVVKEKWEHVSVEYYAQKGRGDEAKRVFGNTPKMLQFFSDFTQYNYPHKKYAQIAVADFIYGGMEHTTCTTQTDRALQDELAHKEYPVLPETLAAHELAHQWFGDLLTCNDWAHGWLNEGFATYFENLWVEHSLGKDEFELTRWQDTQIYFEEDKMEYRRPIVSNLYAQPEDLFDRHLYEKGALVLHTIRTLLGDKGFKDAVAHYVNTHAHQAVQTEDLITAIREATGKNLTGFFDQWIYGAGFPELKVSIHYDSNGKHTHVRVLQTSKTDDKSLFAFPVTIAITLPNKKIQYEKVDIAKREHRFSFPTNGEPHNVVFDAENAILKTAVIQKPRKMWVYQITQDTHVVHRILAAQEIARNPSNDEWNTLYHALRHDPFWGVRAVTATAIGTLTHPKAEAMLQNAYNQEKHPRVLRNIVAALGNYQDGSTSQLLHAAAQRNDSYLIPSEALKGIGRRKNPSDLKLLERAMERKSWNDLIASGAVMGIVNLQSTEAHDKVISFTHPKYSNSVRTAAVTGLAQIGFGREKSISKLLELIHDPYINLQLEAVATLGKIGDVRAIAELEKLKTGHIDGRVKRQAVDSIRAINGGLDLPPYADEKKTIKK